MKKEKTSLREKLLKDRLSLSEADRALRSHRIAERITELYELKSIQHIALYVSFRNEVDVSPLLTLLPEKTYYYPKTDLGSGTMEFLSYDATKGFVTNRWGLAEPASGDSIPIGPATLLIVPALAYDKKGYRLGYGKGFYDRFLSSHPLQTLGVCFSEFLFDALPSEDHDQVVNRIVTELGSLDVTRSAP